MLKVGQEPVNITAVYSIGSDINGIVGLFPKVCSLGLASRQGSPVGFFNAVIPTQNFLAIP